MGFMDKVKAQAEQALSMAQQGVSTGQEKLDSMHARRGADGLLHDLGAAFYAHQRTGGAPEPVQNALAALDAYAAANGPIDTTPTASLAAPSTANPAASGAPAGSPGPAPQAYPNQPQAAQPYPDQPQAAQPHPNPAQPYPNPAQPSAPPAPTFNQPGQYRPPSA